jgi:septum formation protein
MAVGESLLSSSLDMPAAGILPAESSGQPAARRIPPLRLIIAADTLVVLGSGSRTRVIGKPSSVDEARSMLRLLQGKTHRVYSGLCLLNLETRSRETVTACTKIRFAPMSDREIESCLLSGEWQGAAGAYRIQGQASYYIEGIEGSWSCVVGLPIRELYGILCRAGYDFSSVKGA